VNTHTFSIRGRTENVRNLRIASGKSCPSVELTAEAVKRERKERAETERRRIEDHKRQAENAARKAEYDREAEAVKKLAHAWKENKVIKEFAGALEGSLASADVPESEKQELKKMVEWSFRHADFVDP
jgi:hypothetical protein